MPNSEQINKWLEGLTAAGQYAMEHGARYIYAQGIADLIVAIVALLFVGFFTFLIRSCLKEMSEENYIDDSILAGFIASSLALLLSIIASMGFMYSAIVKIAEPMGYLIVKTAGIGA